jgi:hypothetical protein
MEEIAKQNVLYYNRDRQQLVIKESGIRMAPLKLPYGNADFYDIRTGNFFYVDKTIYIEKLEQLNAKYLFFIRPRRFGKSLFLSMLEHYYDLNKKDDFNRLFGDLYIGKHPTERKNKYFILRLNFSGLNTSGSVGLECSFLQTFKNAVIEFFDTYTVYFENVLMLKNRVEQYGDLRSVWDVLFASVKKSESKIYLIIDEYDHFANNIIAMGDGLLYKDIIRASGLVRNFYEVVKIGTESAIDRLFITGVSPIMLDDLTSGFNIAENLTMNPICGEMLGFTEEEVQRMVNQFQSTSLDFDPEMLMHTLRKNYNGYLFHEEGKQKVYNPDMILYFFNQWSMFGRPPKQLINKNVKIDYSRLGSLIENRENRAQLEEIIVKERVTTQIVSEFSFDQMYIQENFISLLFYMGLLTIQGLEEGDTVLGIPNYAMKTVCWEYFGRLLQEEIGIKYILTDKLKAIFRSMARGEIEPFVDFVGGVLRALSRRDMRESLNEQYIKRVLLTYLRLTPLYLFVSERELENGYVDILLEKGNAATRVEWLLELKYIKVKNRNQLEQVRKKAFEQLQKYMASREMMARRPNLKAVALIFIGKSKIVVDHFPR